MTLTLDESFLLNLPLMKRPATKERTTQRSASRLAHRASCMHAPRPARTPDPTLSYPKTRVRGSRLYEAAFILAIIELTRRLHQAYQHAYDKQAVGSVLPKNSGQLCDDRLAGIFGGDGAVFATDRDPDSLKHGAGRDRLQVLSEDPRKGVAHIYASATGDGSPTAYVYTPKGYSGQTEFSKKAHTDTAFPELQNYHQFTYRPGSLQSFGYSGGLMISFIHTGPTDATGRPSPGNTSIVNAAGSVGVGIIGNFGGKVNVGGFDEGYVHTHIIFYRADSGGKTLGRIDPRRVFCHDLGF